MRAIAVLAVMLFHLGVAIPGGFVGVDVFFVISGFLITGIIRRGLIRGTFSLTNFWERRIRRIFPPMFVVLFATLSFGYWYLLPYELEELATSALAQCLMLANVHFWNDTGYFAAPADHKPLLHCWSLAVEEQFYLLLPPLLVFSRRLRDRTLFFGLSVVAFCSFAASVYGVTHYPNACFYLLPTRAWELLVGCMLALAPMKQAVSPRRDTAISLLGLVAIVAPLLFYRSSTPFPGLAAVPPVVGTAAIIFATGNTPGILLARALSVRPLVFVGLISYSLYLWHWPIIVYTKMLFGHFHWKQALFAAVLSFLMAVASWRYVETPIRQARLFTSKRRVFLTSTAVLAILIATSALLIRTEGLKFAYPHSIYVDDVTWTGGEYYRPVPLDRPIELRDLVTLGREVEGERGELDFFVWGDSHGLALGAVLDRISKRQGLCGKCVLDGSFIPLPNIQRVGEPLSRIVERKQILSFLQRHRPPNLVLICRWSGYAGFDGVDVLKPPYEIYDTSLGKDLRESPSAAIQRNLTILEELCSSLGIRLWIVEQVPESGEGSPAKIILNHHRFGVPISDSRRSEVEHKQQQAAIEQVFDEFEDSEIRFINLAAHFEDGEGYYLNFDSGRALYRDQDHLSAWGAERVSAAIREMFAKMGMISP